MGAKPVIHDLDVLRPPPEYVQLGGKKIDISFIPSGIAIDITDIQNELQKMIDTPEKLKKIQQGGKEASKTFRVAADLCAKITSVQHEEMTTEWLLKNTNVQQIKALMEHITEAVLKSLETIEDEKLKNQPAAEVENP